MTDLDAILRAVADAALALDDAQRAYSEHNKPENPDLDDPEIAAEWFGPWDRATEANRVFRAAVNEYRAALAEASAPASAPSSNEPASR